MLFSGVILEGVAGSGKTTALRGVLAAPAFRSALSSIVLSEHHTQRVLESRGPRSSLEVDDNIGLLAAHASYLRGLHDRLSSMQAWREQSSVNPRLHVVIERFHLTHALSYAHLDWTHVNGLDAELAAMGFHLVLLTASEAVLRHRLALRHEQWGSFLTEAGQRRRLAALPDGERLVEYFMQQQAELLELATRSRLRQTCIDTSALSAAAVSQRISKLFDH
jgi:hypothetical protein